LNIRIKNSIWISR